MVYDDNYDDYHFVKRVEGRAMQFCLVGMSLLSRV
jgi:hypothetical protein